MLPLRIAQQSAVHGISRFRPWHTKLNLGLAQATLRLGSTNSHCYVHQAQLQHFVNAAKIVEEIRFQETDLGDATSTGSSDNFQVSFLFHKSTLTVQQIVF